MKHDFDDAPTIPRMTFLPAPDLDPVEWDGPTTPRQDPVIHDLGFRERETLDLGPAALAIGARP